MAFFRKFRDVLGCKHTDDVVISPNTFDGPTYDYDKLQNKIQTYVLMQTFPKIMLLTKEHATKFLQDPNHAPVYEYDSTTKIGWLTHTTQESLDQSCTVVAEHCKSTIRLKFIRIALWLLGMYRMECERGREDRIGNLLFAHAEYGINARVFMQIMSCYTEPTMENVCMIALELSK